MGYSFSEASWMDSWVKYQGYYETTHTTKGVAYVYKRVKKISTIKIAGKNKDILKNRCRITRVVIQWAVTLFLFLSKSRMHVSFINISANFKCLDYFLKTIQHRSRVFYIEIYKHLGGRLTTLEKAEKNFSLALRSSDSLPFSHFFSDLSRVYITRYRHGYRVLLYK